GISSEAATIATRSLRMGRSRLALRGGDSRGCRPRRGAVDELPEPELEHHEAPNAMTMVARAGSVFAPEPADGVIVEDAAPAQAAVEEQRVHHVGQRSAQPLSGRRRESVLRPID